MGNRKKKKKAKRRANIWLKSIRLSETCLKMKVEGVPDICCMWESDLHFYVFECYIKIIYFCMHWQTSPPCSLSSAQGQLCSAHSKNSSMTEGVRPTSIQGLKIVWNNRSHTVLASDEDHVFLLVLRFDITVMTGKHTVWISFVSSDQINFLWAVIKCLK